MIIRNSLANLLGQLLYPILSILLVPFYIHYLGLEGYGLVGFFSMLVALLGVFTKGLGSALQREFARRDGSPDLHPSLRRLLRTFELVYWGIGIVLGAGLVTFSGLVSTHWIQVKSITPGTIQACLLLISLRIALAFPNSVYQSVFVGMQRQVLGNALNVGVALASAAAGVSAVLVWRSVVAFYISDLVTTAGYLLLLRHWSEKVLPLPKASLPASFDWLEVKALWRISVELIWTNGIGLIVTQLDRVIISSLLPVARLGVYNAGIAGGRLLGMFYNPFLTAVYPQTCQLAHKGEPRELGRHLIRNSKVVLIVCMTFGLPISFFAPEILELWTRNAIVVKEGTAVMALYVYGNIFISLAGVFYQGQMALGKMRYGVFYNTVALIWYPVTMWFFVSRMGLVGAAWAWVLYCGVAWLYNTIIMLIVLLKSNEVVKYLKTIALMSGAGVALAFLTRYGANYFFPDWIWGRVFVAGLGAVITGGVGYMYCFILPPKDTQFDSIS
ncbi:MAG: oligosaccharide flippase family protein [Planctomycetota bacterium]